METNTDIDGQIPNWRQSQIGRSFKSNRSLVTSLRVLGYSFNMPFQKFKRAIQTAGIILFFVGCSSNSQSAENSIQSKPTIATSPMSSVASPTSSDASPTSSDAALKLTWEEVCKAAFAAQIGNAAMSEEASWVNDCSIECALPEFVGQCEAMAKSLGIDAP
jgi:hypothetical protein